MSALIPVLATIFMLIALAWKLKTPSDPTMPESEKSKCKRILDQIDEAELVIKNATDGKGLERDADNVEMKVQFLRGLPKLKLQTCAVDIGGTLF